MGILLSLTRLQSGRILQLSYQHVPISYSTFHEGGSPFPQGFGFSKLRYTVWQSSGQSGEACLSIN